VPAESTVPALTVAAVARRLGVAPATLRTWDRRYRLGPSAHLAGSHRRYSGDDVARLMVMRSLTLDGVAPAEAARVALAAELDEGTGQGARGPYLVSVPWRGRPTPTAVIDAVLAGDETACRHLLELPEGEGVLTWWSELVEPARAALVQRTVLGQPGEDPDARLYGAVLAALRRRTAGDRTARIAVVLLLSGPGEIRPVGLHVLSAALSEQAVDARVVTGPLEPHRVVEIATMANPAAVVMIADGRSPDLTVVHALHESHPRLPLFLSIADEPSAVELPWGPTVHRNRSLTGLLHEVLAVCR
jgi:DNA-binding transcriptional MerR regulator